jgi:anti-anti-sigma factor
MAAIVPQLAWASAIAARNAGSRRPAAGPRRPRRRLLYCRPASPNQRADRQLPLATRQYADTLVAAPSGRIDHVTAPQFESELMPLLAQARSGNGALVLDFSDVEYISSGGLRVLMIAATQLRARQGKLVVAGLYSVVAEIFAISRFDRVMTIAASVEDALGLCSPAALSAYRQSPQ